MKTNEHFWSLEEMTKLNNLIKKGKTVSEGAREFSKTSNRNLTAIMYKALWLQKRGLPKHAGVVKEYKAVRFWSDRELEIATNMLAKCNNRVIEAAGKLVDKLDNRSQRCIEIKLFSIKKGKTPASVKVIKSPKETTNGLTLPAGFSFDFTPKRAEMFKDHVKLYF